MKPVDCRREPEVLAAVMSRRWPDRCDDELRHHVAGCEMCRDVAAVAMAFSQEQDASDDTLRDAPGPPSAAHMWWRLQMRARQDAARAVRKPMVVAQGLVAAGIAGFAAAAVGMGWAASAWSWSDAARLLQPAPDGAVGSLLGLVADPTHAALALVAIATGLVMMPVAVYLALSD